MVPRFAGLHLGSGTVGEPALARVNPGEAYPSEVRSRVVRCLAATPAEVDSPELRTSVRDRLEGYADSVAARLSLLEWHIREHALSDLVEELAGWAMGAQNVWALLASLERCHESLKV